MMNNLIEQIDSCEETCLQVHLARGSGPWERARLRGALRDLAGLKDIPVDHSCLGLAILRQLQDYGLTMQPMPIKVNVRSPRPGQTH